MAADSLLRKTTYFFAFVTATAGSRKKGLKKMWFLKKL